ncbi:hypothetical protein [Haloferula sp. BvORR071]|uniref:hypothetical protein n=1 Tax=Haloferula sp. BvORR071 TaxID=1396141 RepID=UPI002240FFD1|nr:hypothetical protein [Haloferula sp. BvORR071]
MKLLLTIIAFLALAQHPAPAAELSFGVEQTQTIFRTWFQERITELELKDAHFTDAYNRILAQWRSANNLPFPFALAEFESVETSSHMQDPVVSMSLKNLSYPEALDQVCKAFGRRLIPGAGVFHLNPPSQSNSNWNTCTYALSPGIFRQLGLDPAAPNKSKLIAGYAELGIRLDFESARLDDTQLVLYADAGTHQRMQVINELLGRGYTITPNGKPTRRP